MPAAALPEDQRLHNLSPKAYEHPSDRAATAALQSIPGLDARGRKLIEFGYERALRQQFLAGSVRLGEDQLPETWADWNAVCARLDLPERYDALPDAVPDDERDGDRLGQADGGHQLALRRPASTSSRCARCSATRRGTSSPTTCCTGRR